MKNRVRFTDVFNFRIDYGTMQIILQNIYLSYFRRELLQAFATNGGCYFQCIFGRINMAGKLR